MEEMVVCLTAFALRESSASWSGGQLSTAALPGGFPTVEEQLHSWMERGKVKVKFLSLRGAGW